MFILRNRGANKREPVLKEELFWMNDKTTAGLDFYWMGIWTYAEKKRKNNLPAITGKLKSPTSL